MKLVAYHLGMSKEQVLIATESPRPVPSTHGMVYVSIDPVDRDTWDFTTNPC
jgi:hypothetical protein